MNLLYQPFDLADCPSLAISGISNNSLPDMLFRIVWLTDNQTIADSRATLSDRCHPDGNFLSSLQNKPMYYSKLAMKA